MWMNQFKITAAFGNAHGLPFAFWKAGLVCRSDVKSQRCLIVTDEIVMAFDDHLVGGSLDRRDFNRIALGKPGLADVIGFGGDLLLMQSDGVLSCPNEIWNRNCTQQSKQRDEHHRHRHSHRHADGSSPTAARPQWCGWCASWPMACRLRGWTENIFVGIRQRGEGDGAGDKKANNQASSPARLINPKTITSPKNFHQCLEMTFRLTRIAGQKSSPPVNDQREGEFPGNR